MTVADLIAEVTTKIRNVFYADRPAREFLRDERAITRAIARYGYECDNRGWDFQVEFIRRDLLDLLRSMRDKSADIKYLPVYLEGAVDRHVRTRAEELAAAAKAIPNIVKRSVKDLAVTNAIEKTPVETLALLYGDLNKRRRQQQKSKPNSIKKTIQPQLL